jgi:4-amino-4-deoxy-L-arabinose transferase-like glycosyltransferase
MAEPPFPPPSRSTAESDAHPRPRRLAPLLLAVCALMLFFGGLGSVPLLEPDEGRYTEIPLEMLARHDFVTPHLNGVLYFEKPPLYYWLNAAALTVFSRPELAGRVAGAGFGLAGVGLAYALGRSAGGRRAGFYAAVFLATAPLYSTLARAAIIDTTLTFFLTAALTCFWLAQGRPDGRAARWLWYGTFAAAALATLAKGLIGFLIPGAVIFFFLLLTRRWAILRRVPWAGGLLLFAAIAVPWHALAAQRNPDFLWFYFVHEHVLRYATAEAVRQQPVWFFLPVLLFGLLPWSGFLPATSRLFRRGFLRERPEIAFLAVWAGFIVLFFSASQSKLIPYVLPACPPLAVLLALGLETAGEKSRWLRAGAVAAAGLLAVVAAAFLWAALGHVKIFSPAFSPVLFAFALPALGVSLLAAMLWSRRGVHEGRGVAALAAAAVLFAGCLWATGPRVAAVRSTKAIASFLAPRLAPGDEVYAFHCYPQTLPVYLGRRIGIVDYRGELAFGIAHLPPQERARRFPSSEQFRPAWTSGRTVYLVMENEDLPRMQTGGLSPGPILMRQEKFLLMTNHAADRAPAAVPAQTG